MRSRGASATGRNTPSRSKKISGTASRRVSRSLCRSSHSACSSSLPSLLSSISKARMLPKRRKPDQPMKAPTPLDDKARALAEKQQKLQAEIERAQRLIEDAPKIREEQKRV